MKTLMLTLLILCCSSITFAQTGSDEYPRFEFYGGFSYTHFKFDRHTSAVSTEPDGVPAIELSATYNVSRYVSLKGAFTAGVSRQTFIDVFPFPCGQTDPNCESLQCRPGDMRPQCVCLTALTCPDRPIDIKRRSSLFEFLGGVQLKDSSREPRIKPFAHALAGIARLNQKVYPNPDDPDSPQCRVCQFTLENTGFAMNFGGGLDLRVSRRVDLRAFQLAYKPTFLGGGIQHNFSVGAGLAFH